MLVREVRRIQRDGRARGLRRGKVAAERVSDGAPAEGLTVVRDGTAGRVRRRGWWRRLGRGRAVVRIRAHEAEKRIEAGHLSKRRVRGELRLRKLAHDRLPVTLAQHSRWFPNRALGDRERPA